MAPALVHFLVGASLLLVLATPLALRFERVRRSALWLVTVGGIWGLAPDVHHIVPAYRRQIYALHDSAVTDLFALHYTLDLDPIRDLPMESIAAAVLVFCVSAVLFGSVSRVGSRYGQRPVRFGSGNLTGVLAGAAIATPILGAALYSGGQFHTLGVLLGVDSLVYGLILTFGCATLAAAVFGLFVELGPGTEILSPRMAAIAGLFAGAITWLAVVMTAPVFLLRVSGVSLTLGHVDVAGVMGFALAGSALGATYVVVARRIRDKSDRTTGPSGLPR